MLASDFVLHGALNLLEKVRDGQLRLDRTIEVSVTNTAEKKRILRRLTPNLVTLVHLLKQNRADFYIAIKRGLPKEKGKEAAVASLESQRASRRADVEYARQQATRMQTLLEGGAASQAELEQAQTALSTSQAQLQAIEAQLREQNVALAFHSVSAPVAGIVGDVPVRVGDSVTRSSVLTTIDQNAGLEVYINVPVQEAPRLKLGLPIHVLDDRGQLLGDETLSYVAASVDPATQSVLAKAVLHATKNVRTEQFVHAQIVWTKEPALLAPLVALDRINGQFFAYVAEGGEGGKKVVRQRAIETGPVIGNDYVVKSGLKAGETLIVSGVQKIGDGVPVKVSPAGASPAPASPGAPGGKGE
jgi:RND family efflux transporter MFP subunit